VFQISERRACKVISIWRATKRYQRKERSDEPYRSIIRDLAQSRPRYGYKRIMVLMHRQGYKINKKKVYRIYCEEGLQVRTKRRKKIVSRLRVQLPRPKRINRIWSMDFVHDRLADQKKIRMLTIVDHFSRESVAIEVGHALTSAEVIRCLSRLKITRGLPDFIQVDNGAEFSGNEMDRWAHENNVKLQFIRPGKPVENAYIESFNGRLRDECLNTNQFYSVEDANEIIQTWRDDYNNWRPHSSLGNKTPIEYIEATNNLESVI
jgi:putative transposase